MVNSKHAFWQALVFTIIIFSIGMIIGFFIEDSRADEIEITLLESEINLLDQQIRNRGITQFQIGCEQAKENTFDFADKIYDEAQKLEKFDSQTKFTDTLKSIHKRYDLLRMILWMESIQLKQQCEEDFHTVVYLFEYASDDINVKAKQASISRLLIEVKNKYGDRVLLIPIAGNLELESINLIKQKYNIEELPVVIIDEREVIPNLPTEEELEDKIF